MSEELRSQVRFEVYLDSVNEWRWRLVAANGQTVADSGEGYQNRADVLNEIRVIQREVEIAKVKIL